MASMFAGNSSVEQNMMKSRHDLAESSKHQQFNAVRKIQAWFRGIITRNYIRKLHENATVLQRYWRNYRVRIFVKQYLVVCVEQVWKSYYYDTMATRIQAVWRGYWTRKTKINFVELRQWLKNIYTKNEETLRNMKKFRQKELEYMESVTEQEAMLWILFILFKLHHLLRTKCIPGVITRIDKTRFTHIEEMLKCFDYERYTWRTDSSCKKCQIDRKLSLMFRGTYFEKCEKEIREFERSVQEGKVPIFRSQPFEEKNGNIMRNERLQRLDYLRKCKCFERGLHENFARTYR